MIHRLTLIILVLALGLSSAYADDPLFSRMEGEWLGHGNRFFPLSGRRVQVDAEVTTSFEVIRGKIALLSQNRITEISSDAAPKTYLSNYWVRPSDSGEGAYELGVDGSTQATSTGAVGRDGVFRVEQDFGGGNQPLVDRSETQFLPGQSLYSDTFTQGTQVQSQTQIEYRRK